MVDLAPFPAEDDDALCASICRNRRVGTRVAVEEKADCDDEEDEDDDCAGACAGAFAEPPSCACADDAGVKLGRVGCWYLLGVPATRPARKLDTEDEEAAARSSGLSKVCTVPGNGVFWW